MAEVEKRYRTAEQRYSEAGVDTESALKQLAAIALSVHCWQGDDVGGFEKPGAGLSGGGIQVTGNYPGKPRNIFEFRSDLEKAYSVIPGDHRLNLHAIYGEFGGKQVDRDQIEPEHFKGWARWAKQRRIKIDFNATCFSHAMADSGFTLSSKDTGIRSFWIEHVKRAREISAWLGKEQGDACIHNLWIPDGSKDFPVDRYGYRRILKESLDDIFKKEYRAEEMKDSLESKLFGIGSEAFVVGSHDFYLGYGLSRGKLVCLDLGHFHPTEVVADKLSSLLQFSDELLLHVSRPMRWDSDHVVVLNDDILLLGQELIRCGRIEDIHIGLDFFDATLNRIGAWAIGARSVLKALLIALLEPHKKLLEYEQGGDYFARLALSEEMKLMPYGDVWNYYCYRNGCPQESEITGTVHDYEEKVTAKRD
ncbi:MAG: L-rhamnose isomerase [Spirochaeta sp.]|nr:L-rhamnose isomerase [Spirochaeta sp.]